MAKHKYKSVWEFEYPTFMKGETEYQAFCMCCYKDIDISHRGKSTLKKHVQQISHCRKMIMHDSSTSIGKAIERNKLRLQKLVEEAQKKNAEPDEEKPPPEDIPVPNLFLCPLCNEHKFSRTTLQEHLYSFHKQKEVLIRRNFRRLEDFNQWKVRTEKESNSKFVELEKYTPADFCTIQYFACHTNKPTNREMGPFCPAEMKLIVNSDEIFRLEYRPNHVGHSTDEQLNDDENEAMVAAMMIENDQFPHYESSETLTESCDASIGECSPVQSPSQESNAHEDVQMNEPQIVQPNFDPVESKENLLKHLGRLLTEYTDKESHEILRQYLCNFETDKLVTSTALAFP